MAPAGGYLDHAQDVRPAQEDRADVVNGAGRMLTIRDSDKKRFLVLLVLSGVATLIAGCADGSSRAQLPPTAAVLCAGATESSVAPAPATTLSVPPELPVISPASPPGVSVPPMPPAGDVIMSGYFERAVAASQNGEEIWVGRANIGESPSYSGITIIDAATGEPVRTVALPAAPESIAFTPDGRCAYLADSFTNTVSVVDVQSAVLIKRIPVARYHYQKWVTVSPDGRSVYVADSYDNTFSIIDTRTLEVTKTIGLGSGGPWNIVISPDGKKAYVTNPQTDNVSVVDTENGDVLGTISTGDYPRFAAITPDGRYVYVSNSSSDTVSVIDTSRGVVTASIAVNSPDAMTISPDGTRVYVVSSEFNSNAIVAIDTHTNSVVRVFDGGADIWGIAVSRDGGRLYLTDNQWQALSVLATEAP